MERDKIEHQYIDRAPSAHQAKYGYDDKINWCNDKHSWDQQIQSITNWYPSTETKTNYDYNRWTREVTPRDINKNKRINFYSNY